MIAFLGTGLMGSEFVRGFRERGESIRVWNRTLEKARPLASEGIEVFADPADAVRGATRIHLSLSDDAAVETTLERAAAGLAPGATILDHTTTAPRPTAERTRRWIERGFDYLHAPVFMGPKNAREATGLMLACGQSARFERVRGVLATMTGRLLYLGEAEDRAAAFKLFGNMMIVVLASGLGDVLALASGLGIDPVDARNLFDSFKVANQLDIRGKKMASGDFQPTFELDMARKDVRLMLETAEATGVRLEVVPAIARHMDALISAGLGNRDLGVVAQRSPKD